MSQTVEIIMSALKKLWTKIARCFEALDGIDDPAGTYILALGKRVDKLELAVDDLKSKLHSSNDVTPGLRSEKP